MNPRNKRIVVGNASSPTAIPGTDVSAAEASCPGFVYAGFRSLGAEGSVHALQRRAAVLLLVGSSYLFELILYFSHRSREAGKARMDGGPALSPPST